jgi:hypothetical protein
MDNIIVDHVQFILILTGIHRLDMTLHQNGASLLRLISDRLLLLLPYLSALPIPLEIARLFSYLELLLSVQA